MYQYDLSGKKAVITGGGGILCGAFARKLAQCGAAVAILDLSGDAAQKVANEIIEDGGQAIAVACNVLDKESIKQAEQFVYGTMGEYHILINGAGGNNPKATTTNEYYQEGDVADPSITSFFDLGADGFDEVFRLNLMGTLLPSQVFGQRLAQVKNGCIINMSSMSAVSPLTKIPAYSAAKAAVVNFTQWLAVHFAGAGLRVNAIAPGFFETNQNKTLLRNPDGSLTARSDKILSHTPLGRFGQVDDLFGVLLWLCDESASGFITGITVPVDGGFMAYSGV